MIALTAARRFLETIDWFVTTGAAGLTVMPVDAADSTTPLPNTRIDSSFNARAPGASRPTVRPHTVHIGVNLLFLIPGETGGRETYTRELIRAIRLERPGLQVTGFIGQEAAALSRDTWLNELDTVTLPANTRSRPAWALAEQLLLPRAARGAGIDLLHSPANTAPIFGRFRRVVTIHDLLYKRHPELFGPVTRTATAMIIGGAARTAHRLITGCDAARGELVDLLGLHPDRIDVVPHGFGTPRIGSGTSIVELRTRFDFGDRPFILVSAIRVPHKNLPSLIDALSLIPRERRPLLAITGPGGSDDDELVQRIRKHQIEADVRLLGWLAQPDLEGLFAGATCFVFPTLYEGFGLPVLEAMARDLPVACSDIGVLREVSGDAALLFDPHRPRSISDAIERLLGSPRERERLVRAGRVRAAWFTWQRAAQGTLSSFDRAMLAP